MEDYNYRYQQQYQSSEQGYSSQQQEYYQETTETVEHFNNNGQEYTTSSYTTSSKGPNKKETYEYVNPKLTEAPSYELSNCQGRKKALLIGINYIGSSNELKGCINDVQNIKNFITTRFGFKEEDMVILTDDQQEQRFIPTRANIIAAIKWLVGDAQPNDSYFFHFSGHGGCVEDKSGDEEDGIDETIYPVDFENFEGDSGQIIDNDLHELLVKPLPKGCRLTAIFDSCHSGTVLDLPYVYSTKGTIKSQNIFKDAGLGLLSAGMAYASGDKNRALSSIVSMGQQIIQNKKLESSNRENFSSAADVVMFSGCKDDQTSADASEAGKATGAMSYALIRTLREEPHQSYNDLLNNVRDILREKYSQRPQFSCSHPLDVDLEFIC